MRTFVTCWIAYIISLLVLHEVLLKELGFTAETARGGALAISTVAIVAYALWTILKEPKRGEN